MAALTRSLVAGGAALTSLIAIVVSVAAPAPTLSPTATPDFPERAYLLTLPERVRLGAEDVVVTENGGPVRDLRVSSAGAARLRKMGVVLAIDSSGSMRGAAFSGAFDAARSPWLSLPMGRTSRCRCVSPPIPGGSIASSEHRMSRVAVPTSTTA